MSTARLNEQLKAEYARKAQTATDPLELLRAQCLARGAAGIKGIGRTFRIMDDDENKRLDMKEFKKGLKDYGVYIECDDAEELFRRLDLDNDGSLDFNEFLIALRPPMSNHRKSLVMKAFGKLDKNSDGVITVADLIGVYSVQKHPKYLSGQWSEQKCLEEWLACFEPPNDANAEVTVEEFMNYYAGVSASIDNEAYFDLMMRNAWKL